MASDRHVSAPGQYQAVHHSKGSEQRPFHSIPDQVDKRYYHSKFPLPLSWIHRRGLPLNERNGECLFHSATPDQVRQPTELLNVLGQTLQSGFIVRALDGSHLALNQVPLVGPVVVHARLRLGPPGSGHCVSGLLEVLLWLDWVDLRG